MTDARTVIADQLGGSFESNGTDNDWTDQADAVLAALDDAGFVVAARPVVSTTREAAHIPGWSTGANAARVEQQQPTDAQVEAAAREIRLRDFHISVPESIWMARAVVAALGTTHPTEPWTPARCQSCGWAWQHDNPPPATCPRCRARATNPRGESKTGDE